MILQNYQKGDLVAWSAHNGALIAGIYAGTSRTGHHFWPLAGHTLDRLEKGKKPYVDYITGYMKDRRIVKISPDVLDEAELKIYNKIKGI